MTALSNPRRGMLWSLDRGKRGASTWSPGTLWGWGNHSENRGEGKQSAELASFLPIHVSYGCGAYTCRREPGRSVYEKLLLLSRFSRVQLCATPQTAAHQAPPSLGFSRQEYWRGLPFPSLMHEKWKVKVKLFSRVRLLAAPWTAVYQAPPSMGFSRQEYWSGLPLPSLLWKATWS